MLISEIFESINGESVYSGLRTVFIRTFGCDLRCSYCDSMYAVEGEDYIEMSVSEVLEAVKAFDCNRVTLTGGEPLLQKDVSTLIERLVGDDYQVEIETNGANVICDYVRDKNVTITMDWKCPSSGMLDRMYEGNLYTLRTKDVLKCVVGSTSDLDEMKRISDLTEAQIYVSPIFGQIELEDIANYLIDNKLDDVRLQLQLHKIVWDPDKRGV